MIDLLTKELMAKTQLIENETIKADAQVQITQLELASKERIESVKAQVELLKAEMAQQQAALGRRPARRRGPSAYCGGASREERAAAGRASGAEGLAGGAAAGRAGRRAGARCRSSCSREGPGPQGGAGAARGRQSAGRQ